MNFEDIRPFLETHHRGVVSTFQADGSVQSSIVYCGVYENKAAFVIVRGNSAKVRNLRRNPSCTVLAVDNNWRSYVVVEGKTTLYDYRNTDAEEYRVMLREIYRACGDSDHPDWEEYDVAMKKQDAVAVLVEPSRIYGLLR